MTHACASCNTKAFLWFPRSKAWQQLVAAAASFMQVAMATPHLQRELEVQHAMATISEL